MNFTAEIPATITQDQLDDVLREAASAARGVPSRDAGPGVPPTRPLEGVPGRELRVIPLQGTLDLIEPALVVLGERHDSFSPPGTPLDITTLRPPPRNASSCDRSWRPQHAIGSRRMSLRR